MKRSLVSSFHSFMRVHVHKYLFTMITIAFNFTTTKQHPEATIGSFIRNNKQDQISYLKEETSVLMFFKE